MHRLLYFFVVAATSLTTLVTAQNFVVSWESNWVLTASGMIQGSTSTVEWTTSLSEPFSDSLFDRVVVGVDGEVRLEVPMSLRDDASMFFRMRNMFPTLQMDMVEIPGGTNSGADPDYGTYSLTVSAFYMDRTTVTKTQWDIVYYWAISNGYIFQNAGLGKGPDHPVNSVNWYDCAKWCNARSEMEGKTPCYTVSGSVLRTGDFDRFLTNHVDCNFNVNGYRLPTSEEWIYAARGGYSSLRFPWGNTIQHTKANYYSSSSYSYDTSSTRGYHPSYNSGGEPYTSPVGSFPPNGYGLYDMAGNVWEWCWDGGGRYRDLLGGAAVATADRVGCGCVFEKAAYLEHGYYGFRTICR